MDKDKSDNQIEISADIKNSVLTGKLPAHLPEGCTKEVPAVGWCAHLDTIDINMSPEIHPQVLKNYQGGDVCLNAEKGIYIRTAEHPELDKYVGQDIVFTDGTSVLGADNKAAIANIMVALETLVTEGRYHGDIYVAFVPDDLRRRAPLAGPRCLLLSEGGYDLPFSTQRAMMRPSQTGRSACRCPDQ